MPCIRKIFLMLVIFFLNIFAYGTTQNIFLEPHVNKSGGTTMFLPDALAFQTNVQLLKQSHKIEVTFKIANGFHVYANKIKFNTDPNSPIELGAPVFPKPQRVHNKLLGDFSVYTNNIQVLIPYTISDRKLEKAYNVLVEFSGCKELTYCYPPIKRKYKLKFD